MAERIAFYVAVRGAFLAFSMFAAAQPFVCNWG